MRVHRRITLALLSLLVLFTAGLVLLVLLGPKNGPDVRETEYIRVSAEGFLASWNVSQPTPEESLVLVESEPYINEDEQKPDWVLLTLAQQNSRFTDDIGSGGLIGIGRLEREKWEYKLLGDTGFENWLAQLPESLLNDALKSEFNLIKERSAVSILIPGKKASLSSLQELKLNLPWKFGESYQITNLPSHGHHKGTTQEAIDFGTPEGTQLLAIADGTVMAIKDNSNARGCDVKFAGDANYIRIKIAPHLAVLYLHTQVNSIAAADVKVGDKVEIGQPIVKSGTTGFTCNFSGTGPGAHLHIILEELCGSDNTKICGSVELRFEEFKSDDPRYGEDYVSQNKSPEKRLAEAEKQRREQEQADIARIEDTVKGFLPVYTCSTLKECDQSGLITTWVTEGLMGELFPTFSFCFPCPIKWDSNNLESVQFLPFSLTETDQITVATKEIWKSISREDLPEEGWITHYTVTDYFLVKQGGIWRVDGYEITCGYAKNEHGEINRRENLDGCPWQPPSGSTQ